MSLSRGFFFRDTRAYPRMRITWKVWKEFPSARSAHTEAGSSGLISSVKQSFETFGSLYYKRLTPIFLHSDIA